jgi:hypothetical protein
VSIRAVIATCFALLCFGAAMPLRAQELLQNRSFETPVTPANGNNFYATIPNWTAINVTPAQTQPFNVIRPHAGYAGNPTVTPTGGGLQYFDVNSASGTLRQTVTVPSQGMVDFSGWFSVRDNQQALSGLTINIRDSGGTIVGTASTSFLATDPIGLWKQVSGANVPVAAGTYIFEVVMADPSNFDLASFVFKPAVTLVKTSAAYSDPQNGTVNPKLIPGAVAEYAIVATSPADYTVSNNSIVLTDATPANTDMVVTNIGGAGSGPAAFTAGTSGLSYSFTSLASTTDNIDFSNNNGTSWTYAPVADANGVDPNVTTVRLRPQGMMAASSTASFRLRYRIR